MEYNLLDAARYGNVEQIQYILKDFINRNVSEDNQTALHLAAWNGHAGVVEELIKQGADPNIQDDNGDTPLHHVCKISEEHFGDHEEEYLAIVDQLIKHPTIDVNTNNSEDVTALALSLENKKPMVALKLITHGASVIDLDGKGKSALHLLAMNFSDQYENQKDLLDAILEHNDIDINQHGMTALYWACYKCPPKALAQLLQHLLEKGARADIQENSTALHYLCKRGDGNSFSNDEANATLDLLLKANPDMLNHPADGGGTPLHFAIMHGSFNIALKLLDYTEIDIHAKTFDAKFTALHLACLVAKIYSSKSLVDVVKKLMAKDADLTAHDNDGDAPLHLACFAFGQNRCVNEYTWDIVKIFLDQDGNHLHPLNNEGLTPLMYAAKSNVPLNSLFQILSHTGGTILDHPWTLNNKEQEATVPKRKKAGRAMNPSKKQKRQNSEVTSCAETSDVVPGDSPEPIG